MGSSVPMSSIWFDLVTVGRPVFAFIQAIWVGGRWVEHLVWWHRLVLLWVVVLMVPGAGLWMGPGAIVVVAMVMVSLLGRVIWVRWELGVIIRGGSIQYGGVGWCCCRWLCQWFLGWIVDGARCRCSGCHGHGQSAWEGRLGGGSW